MLEREVFRKFQVIEGGGMPSPSWLDIPSTVIGPSVVSPSVNAVYRISQVDFRKALSQNRRQPILDLWSVVLGEIPPVPNARVKWSKECKKLSSLMNANACFRGLKRPMGKDDRGFDCFALVSKPSKHFIYEPSINCNIKLVDLPDDLVHVTYIRCDHPETRPVRGRQLSVELVGKIGVITHAQFVEADSDYPNLPTGFADRYRQRLW